MLVQAELGISIKLKENKIAVVVIENPTIWRDIQKSFIKQIPVKK